MAAPLRQPSFGQISDGALEKCFQTQGADIDIDPSFVRIHEENPYAENVYADGDVSAPSGSGAEDATTPIQNLWALAIPDEV
jgi:hypothetical protein